MIDRSTIWPYRDGEPGEFIYQRYGHPTGVEAERRVGKLDGGRGLLFSSGAGATSAFFPCSMAMRLLRTSALCSSSF